MISLSWRPLATVLGGGHEIETSLTEREAAWLRRLARDRTVLEVGSAYGFSACCMGAYAEHLIAVDRHDVHPGSYAIMQANLAKHQLLRKVTTIVGDSLSVLPSLGGEFDLIFLDGCHHLAGLRADLMHAELLLAEDGRIAVHDYDETACPDVRRAVEASGLVGSVRVDTLWVSGPE